MVFRQYDGVRRTDGGGYTTILAVASVYTRLTSVSHGASVCQWITGGGRRRWRRRTAFGGKRTALERGPVCLTDFRVGATRRRPAPPRRSPPNRRPRWNRPAGGGGGGGDSGMRAPAGQHGETVLPRRRDCNYRRRAHYSTTVCTAKAVCVPYRKSGMYRTVPAPSGRRPPALSPSSRAPPGSSFFSRLAPSPTLSFSDARALSLSDSLTFFSLRFISSVSLEIFINKKNFTDSGPSRFLIRCQRWFMCFIQRQKSDSCGLLVFMGYSEYNTNLRHLWTSTFLRIFFDTFVLIVWRQWHSVIYIRI